MEWHELQIVMIIGLSSHGSVHDWVRCLHRHVGLRHPQCLPVLRPAVQYPSGLGGLSGGGGRRSMLGRCARPRAERQAEAAGKTVLGCRTVLAHRRTAVRLDSAEPSSAVLLGRAEMLRDRNFEKIDST